MSDRRPRSKIRTVIALAAAAARNVPTAPAIRMPVGASNVKNSIRADVRQESIQADPEHQTELFAGNGSFHDSYRETLTRTPRGATFTSSTCAPSLSKRLLNSAL